MKYLVVANKKFLVSVEANSALSAEHCLLDNYRSIKAALAFDEKACETDTFKGMMREAETIGPKELAVLDKEYCEAEKLLKATEDDIKYYEREIARMKKKLEEAMDEAWGLRDRLNEASEAVGGKLWGED